MKSAVIVFPGSNREPDAARAIRLAGGDDPVMVWHTDTELPPVDLVMIPGGFAHGDYLRAGAIAARSPIMRAVADYAARGGYVLGVCNGFQVLTEARLLPGALMRNACLTFVCRKIRLKVENTNAFTRDYERGAVVTYPCAHHDGNYRADDETIARLEGEGRVALRYVDNPNGSANDIAGIVNETGNVLGMMPHPENAVEPLLGSTDGLPLFTGMVASVASGDSPELPRRPLLDRLIHRNVSPGA
ncbi:phosphoribosylformylglycinamidine synthase subunit PurQ [Acuticoccus sediminis]|uniref:Phosphoribosylformylglycinamidine synthase subunit PurQ n=1 Tax=Acuticoccus sediminis TaxID=2184697 RepID=A0A8B2NXW5_9HYPH|nr:phosphoribosylformylglycinamidine synthase subunit PurQ [Acuticoccus sediminis]RAI00618.1 phosphoribosylformylglycinamidine synthase subunit PurQ [Acuticoccus sediminis]